MPKIRMINDSQGIAVDGKEIEVSDDRAKRWVFDKKCAEYCENKEKKQAEKEIKEAEAEAEKRQKELMKELEEKEQ